MKSYPLIHHEVIHRHFINRLSTKCGQWITFSLLFSLRNNPPRFRWITFLVSLFLFPSSLACLIIFSVERKGIVMHESIKGHQVNDIYQQLLERIRQSTNPKLFDTMFGADSFELKSLDGGKALFVADSESNAAMIRSAFLKLIGDTLDEIAETHYDVEITDRGSYLKRKDAVEQANTQFFQNSHLSPRYTFENFVTGPSNKNAYLASLFAVENPGRSNPIFLYSKSGLGKTHLLQSIGNAYTARHPDAKVLYITSDDFISEFVRFAKGNKDSENLKDFFSTVDLLLMDDIQFLADKEKTEIMFFNVFNLLVSQNKQIVITSDRSPAELKGLSDRLVSRFLGGLSIGISNPEKETLIEILKTKIKANNLSVDNFDPSVLDYLALNYSQNVRELEGAFTKMLFALTIHKETGVVTLDFAKSVFEDDEVRRANSGKITIDAVIDVVSQYYSLTESQLKSKVRTSQIALARQIAMYLSRTLLNLPYQEIGRQFGKDHTTVLANVQKIGNTLPKDPTLTKAVEELTTSIKKNMTKEMP
jgi:chromosomal replication initiator protein